mgnify:CR=1 FL=1
MAPLRVRLAIALGAGTVLAASCAPVGEYGEVPTEDVCRTHWVGLRGAKPPTQVVEEVVQPVTGGGGSTTAKVTETVNETVNSVDETVTGGALQETGVTGLTEEVVNGVAGPESALGKTVDETVNTVGGLLGGSK